MAERALILGGGGVTGIGWELGFLAGLVDHEIDVVSADVIIGTSAGSVVAVHVAAGVDLRDSYDDQLAGRGREVSPNPDFVALARIGGAALRTRDAGAFARRVGQIAIGARTIPEAQRRAVIAARLPVRTWPDRDLRITAIDASSGSLVVFDRQSGTPLIDAVAASCAVPGVWPAVTIDGRRYVDGGVASVVNGHLAADCARVLMIAPMTKGLGPMTDTSSEVEQLRAAGVDVALITPDRDSQNAMGRNVLDPARRGPAAEAGRRQAASEADRVARLWEG